MFQQVVYDPLSRNVSPASSMQASEPSPSPRRPRNALALGAIGLGLVTITGGIWALRLPLAQAGADAFLRQNGIEAKLRVRALSPSRILIEDVRLGPRTAPDLTLERVDLGLRWKGFSPNLERVVLARPRLHARWTEHGLSYGSLDRLLPPPSAKAPPFALPSILVEIRDGMAVLDSPLGRLTATGSSAGRLGTDFAGKGAWLLQSGPDRIAGPFSLRADASGLAADLRGNGTGMAYAGWQGSAVRLEANVRSDRGLTQIRAGAEVFADAITGQGQGEGEGLDLSQPALRLEGGLDNAKGSQMRWRARADLGGQDGRAAGLAFGALTAKLALDGNAVSAGGRLEGELRRLAGPGFTAETASLAGPVAAQSLSPLKARFEPALRAEPITATAQTRAALRAGLASLEASPLHDFAKAAAAGLDQALRAASLRADGVIQLGPDGMTVQFAQNPGLFADNTASLQIQFPPQGLRLAQDGKLDGSGALILAGPGLPSLKLELQHLTRSQDGTLSLRGETSGQWQAGASRLALPPRPFSAQIDAKGAGSGQASAHLAADLHSPQMHVSGLRLPVDLDLAWGSQMRLALSGPGCAQMQADRVEAGDLRLDRPGLGICAPGGVLFAAQDRRASGGFRLTPLAWRGTLSGMPLALETGALLGQWHGQSDAPRLRLDLPRALLNQQGGMHAALGKSQMELLFTKAFSASGKLENTSFEVAMAPTRLSGLKLDWALSPSGELRVRDGTGLLTAASAEIPLHQPIRLAGLELSQAGNRLEGGGRALLQANGAELGRFTLVHDLNTQVGEALWTTQELIFSPALQPFQISETLRGVIELARGAIGAQAQANWDANGALKVNGRVDLKKLSFSTLALGPIDGVNGQIVFDDLLAFTTPPGQSLTVDKINPGLPVDDGRFIFQLEPGAMLRLESATWPYAKGVLSIDPLRVQLGGEITKFNLRLSKVDLPALLDQLSLSNSVRATGTVEGEFPLVFTPAGGRIENGRLAAIGAGLIAMQSPGLDQTLAQGGDAGQAGGVGLLQALQGFSYDELALKNVNGAIDGEITADILFAGENVAPISLPVPGGRNLVGLPYRFKVSVRAPLLQLSRSAQNALDYKGSINQALELEKQREAAAEAAQDAPKSPAVPR